MGTREEIVRDEWCPHAEPDHCATLTEKGRKKYRDLDGHKSDLKASILKQRRKNDRGIKLFKIWLLAWKF